MVVEAANDLIGEEEECPWITTQSRGKGRRKLIHPHAVNRIWCITLCLNSTPTLNPAPMFHIGFNYSAEYYISEWWTSLVSDHQYEWQSEYATNVCVGGGASSLVLCLQLESRYPHSLTLPLNPTPRTLQIIPSVDHHIIHYRNHGVRRPLPTTTHQNSVHPCSELLRAQRRNTTMNYSVHPYVSSYESVIRP